MKKYFTLLLVCIVVWSCNKATTPHEEIIDTSNQSKVIAYIAGWEKIDAKNINAEALTHINYAFARLIDGEVVSGLENDSANFAELHKLKKINPDLKILVSIGGWGWSGDFSDASLTDESRKKVAETAINYLTKYKLDGLDIDWEYPGLPAAGNTHRAEDKENFTLLMKVLREALDKEGEKNQQYYLLTIASGGMDEYFEHVDLNKAHQYLDFINIMSYDLYHGWDSISGHHAGLYLSTACVKQLSADHSVQLHLDQNVPIEKLVLGIPFYGRKWEGVNIANNGYNQTATTGGSGINFNEIYKYTTDTLSGYKRYWDTTAQVPYLWNEATQTFISYEDAESLKIKCGYVNDKKMGGVMFWEYHGDKDGILLNAID